jgi:LmbE family N-acetylglucosaminyl deacetylase
MLKPAIRRPDGRPLRVLATGAHPDDIEIGAGGTLLQLADSGAPVEVSYVVMTGTPQRHDEARAAAAAFLPGADVSIELHSLAEGRLPLLWGEVKEILESVAAQFRPDIIFAPSTHDAHQDHRTIAEIVPTVFRDSLYLAYEIPKWDGDIWRPETYVPLPREVAQRKVALLSQCFPSQLARDWWDDEMFLGLARIRGMECREQYAEAFGCTKAVLDLSALAD